MKLNKMTFGYIFFIFTICLSGNTCGNLFFSKIIDVSSSENNYLDENQLNHKVEKIKIASDNELNSWYYKKNENFKTLLFFHGNAGSLENRIYKLNDLSKLDLNYLIVAYRGFSGNKGSPSEQVI